MLLASAATPVVPANTSLADLTATQAIAMLCARDTTAVSYVQALFGRFDSGGFECLNAFISLNRSQVRCRLTISAIWPLQPETRICSAHSRLCLRRCLSSACSLQRSSFDLGLQRKVVRACLATLLYLGWSLFYSYFSAGLG